jgi:hypothetical protein
MQDKIEWELVDEPSRQSDSQRRSQAQGRTQENAHGKSGVKQILQTIMGPWWRWKLVGAGIFAAIALAMIAMLTGVLAVIAAAGAVLAIAVGKVRQWTRRHSGALVP